MKRIIELLKETWQEFQDDEAMQMSAALSYYALFSLFPLLLLLVAVLGFVLQYYPAAQDAQTAILQGVSQTFSPQLGEVLGDVLENVKDQAGTATGIGLVTLLLGASGVFQQLDASFNKIWNVPKDQGAMSIVARARQMITKKLTSFGMVLSVGFLLLVSTALTGLTQFLLSGAGELLGVAGDSWLAGFAGFAVSTVVTIGLNALIFALLFKFLPDTRVDWGDVWIGAIATSIVWEIAKRLLAIYIGNIGNNSAAYGAIGAVLVLVAWIYFSSLVLYLGGEFTYVYTKRHGSRVAAPEPEPPAAPVPTVVPIAAIPGNTSGLARATGRGFVVGAVSGLVAALTALVAGAFLVISRLNRVFRRP